MWENFEGKTEEKRLKRGKICEKQGLKGPFSQRSFGSKHSKKTQMKEDREFQIFTENQILLKKMMDIDSKFAKIKTVKKESNRTPKALGSRRKIQSKIYEENQKMIKRLQSAHSNYPIARFQRESRYNQDIQARISRSQSRTSKKTEKVCKRRESQSIVEKILERVKIRNQQQTFPDLSS